MGADDVCEHFEAFGAVADLELLEDHSSATDEIVRLWFTDQRSRVSAMQHKQHRIKRISDGKEFPVKVFVSFADNAASR